MSNVNLTKDLVDGINEFFNFEDRSVGIYAVEKIDEERIQEFKDVFLGAEILAHSAVDMKFKFDDTIYLVLISPSDGQWRLHTLTETSDTLPKEDKVSTSSLKKEELIQCFLSIVTIEKEHGNITDEYDKEFEKIYEVYASLYDVTEYEKERETSNTKKLLDKLVAQINLLTEE